VNIVWFKRDFRLEDHPPLWSAMQAGVRLLLVAFVEPELLRDPHYSARHWRFVNESVADINQRLAPFHQKLHLLEESPIDFFQKLHQTQKITAVFSHEETGVGTTFQRDIYLKKWFVDQEIDWKEFQCNGVVRGKKNRQDWTKQWHAFMEAPMKAIDLKRLPAMPSLSAYFFQNRFEISDQDENIPFQKGGESEAHRTMDSFFNERFWAYAKHISKPLLSRENCSRLSPYLAWGNVSIRQVFQRYIAERSDAKKRFQLDFFASRIHWHCHFIQKFEMEPRMEFETVNHGYKDLGRLNNAAWHEAVITGHTGFPLVDACIRCVAKTGYINFRMRAMLVSFYTHHLWLNWQPFAHWLAQQFLDFEPGIHYGQFQMQSAVTGINTVRIYNPIKQSQEHDADADFILKWVPELAKLPAPLVHEPWQCSPMEEMLYDFQLGRDYPKPMVDIEETGRHAREVLWQQLKDPKVKQDAARILKRHTNPGRKRMQ
jgi:deoxyribodipyrimidine photo-lyase